jgi:hypothetical protein
MTTALERVELGAESRWGRGTTVDVAPLSASSVLVIILNPNGSEVMRAIGADRTRACNALLALLHLTPTFEDET